MASFFADRQPSLALSERAHAAPVVDVAEVLEVDPANGLDEAEATRRLLKYGPNEIHQAASRSIWIILRDQFTSPVIWLLAGATGVSLALGDWAEAIAITIVIAINALIGFVSEWRATRSMEALRRLASETSTVLRERVVSAVPASQLVPGDIVLLQAGDVITADLRLLAAAGLTCDESTLTGESVPVGKGVHPLAADIVLAERTNMAFRGSSVARGSGTGVVVSTGMETELGRIAQLVAEAEATASPLEAKLDRLTRQLIWITLSLAAISAVAGLVAGRDLWLMVQTGIALAVAAIPEGLPVVATLALARGMLRLARRNVLVRRLSKVETLGSTTVIFADKTGTLTENRMRSARMVAADSDYSFVDVHDQRRLRPTQADAADDMASPILSDMLMVAGLCNTVANEGALTGDPLEIALLEGVSDAGVDWRALRQQCALVREEPFDADVRMMATVHQTGKDYLVAVKGAPEAVLAASTEFASPEGGSTVMTEGERRRWLERNAGLARDGLRIIALAKKSADNPDQPAYRDLQFLGLVGLRDPARADAADAVKACHLAGVRVVMVTGDQKATAHAIAAAVGVVDDGDEQVVDGQQLAAAIDGDQAAMEAVGRAHVFARTNPRQKLDLVALGQSQGEIAAMTGDGVNDAPALRKADIGIALGQRGTQAAREAADMVIRDDSLSSIVEAIRQGRIIFGNIRKFVLYLLSCNLSEILVIFAASVSALPLPLLPLQILFLNLVTDVFPAIALGAGKGTDTIMQRPPRDPRESIITPRHWRVVFFYGVLITASVMAAFVLTLFVLERPVKEAVTVSFLTLAFAQLWHVFNMRSATDGVVDNDVVRNPLVWLSLAVCTGGTLAALYIQPLADILQLVRPDGPLWLLIVTFSLLPVMVVQMGKAISRNGHSDVAL